MGWFSGSQELNLFQFETTFFLKTQGLLLEAKREKTTKQRENWEILGFPKRRSVFR